MKFQEASTLDKLYKEFPDLFAQNTYAMSSVGDGWYSILQDAFKKLNELNKKLSEEEHIKILQFKEKFAELRIYTNYLNKEAENIVAEAAIKAAETCEICGNKGESRSCNGWLKTICQNCYEKRTT